MDKEDIISTAKNKQKNRRLIKPTFTSTVHADFHANAILCSTPQRQANAGDLNENSKKDQRGIRESIRKRKMVKEQVSCHSFLFPEGNFLHVHGDPNDIKVWKNEPGEKDYDGLQNIKCGKGGDIVTYSGDWHSVMGEIWHLRVYSAMVTVEKTILGQKVGIVKTVFCQFCHFIN